MAARNTAQSSAGYHRVAQFVECPQKFAYREILGLGCIVEPQATGQGTVLHEALRAHYLGTDVGLAIESLPQRYAPHIGNGLRLYRAYVEHYPLSKEPFEVLDAECELEVLLDGRSFTRRVDLVVLDIHDRRLYVCDHKTAGRPSERASGARLDWSLATQDVVGRAILPRRFQHSWGGVLLNLVGTGQEVEFRRVKLDFDPRMLESIPRSILHYYKQIEALEGTDPWSYPRSGACMGRYGVCDYLDLCRHGKAFAREFESH